MKRKFVLFFAAVCALLPEVLQAQGIKAVRINEVLVCNDSGYRDAYGVCGSWFELYNTGVKTLSLGGCYLTNDTNNKKKYRIPKNAQDATLAPGAYAVFFAYNEPSRSPFHVNFNLTDTGLLQGGRAYLALYDQSGKELIDSVSYVVSVQRPNISFGKLEGVADAQWQQLETPTPRAMNHFSNDMSRAEIYQQKDPHGWIITLTSMSVVFLLLVIIASVFKGTGSYFKKKARKADASAKGAAPVKKPAAPVSGDMDDEVTAVIAAALHLYQNDCHEVEDNGFNLQRTFNQPSPWANKVLNFRRTPIRKN
ncbi:MAG: OadG family protein [Bacteroidales bacterium]|nr:OadG family protein [Bacteroidales bacterium]